MKENKPKWQMPIILSLTILIIVLLLGAFYISSTKQDVNLQNRSYLSEIAVQNAQFVQNVVSLQLDKLEALVNVIGDADTFSLEYTMQVLRAESKRTAFKRLAYIPAGGNAVTTDQVELNVADRDYYYKALGGERCVSDQMTDKTDGEEIHVYAVPLYHKGEQKGVVIATCSTKVFSNIVSDAVFSGEGFSYIIEQDGAPVVGSANPWTQMKFSNFFEELLVNQVSDHDIATVKRNMEQGENGIIEYSNDGQNYMGAYTRIGINEWYLLSVIPRGVIFESSDRLINRSITLVVGSVLMLGLLLAFIINQTMKSNQKLAHLAFYDPLTGGNNLNNFKILAAEAIAKNREGLYLLRVDIDNFKLINDMYGYEEGDRILLAMDRLIDELLPTGSIHGRVGSDNFICLLREESGDALMKRGERFRTLFRQQMLEKKKHFIVNFTSGAYQIPNGECKPEDLDIDKFLDRAAMAHRSAKLLAHEWKFAFYSDDMRDNAIRIKHVEDSMHAALEHKEFVIYLQPKYNLESGQMEGAEALIRWQKDGRLIPPADFIPVFERNGFIVNIDLFVLEEVCRLQRRWLDMGLNPLPVSVNQSKPLVCGDHYVDRVYDMVSKYTLPPKLIELELLESLIHDNIKELAVITDRLRQLGILVCIDDFGSGYSSLNMIKDICVDVLKIDREFLSSAESNTRAEVVLRNIIDLAKDLEMSVVTEGVETVAQAELLRRLSCDTAQGFLYARPMPIVDYEEKLRQAVGQRY